MVRQPGARVVKLKLVRLDPKLAVQVPTIRHLNFRPDVHRLQGVNRLQGVHLLQGVHRLQGAHHLQGPSLKGHQP